MKSRKSPLERIQELMKLKGNEIEEKDQELLTAEMDKDFEEFKSELDLMERNAVVKRSELISQKKQKLIDQRNQILQLALIHGVQLKDEHLEKLFSTLKKDSLSTATPSGLSSWEESLKLAELISFFNLCIVNRTPVTFSTTVKGQKKSLTIDQSYFMLHFSKLANTLLVEDSDERYSKLFNWSRKEYKNISFEEDFIEWKQYCDENNLQIPEGCTPKPKIMLSYPEVYGNYQIDKIIQYEKETIERAKKYTKHHKSYILSEIVSYFRQEDVFKKEYKTIQSDEACFLYDVLAILEIIVSDGNEAKTEKYDFIKRRI
ncbi:MAG: hypothetical protein H6Q12_617 [Bacteroidetes bacterium]|nr:hypothetical protein [Bacteroidota bacterium]